MTSGRSRRAGRRALEAAGIAHAVGTFIHRAEGEFLTPGFDAKTRALGLDKNASGPGQPPEVRFRGRRGQPAGKRGRPTTEMFAQKIPLRATALREVIGVQLVLQSIGFPGGKDAHELEFEAEVILPLAGIGSNLKPKGMIEGGDVGEAVRLEKRVRLDIAIFDFVQWAGPSRGMSKCGQPGIEKRLKILPQKLRDAKFSPRGNCPGSLQTRSRLGSTKPAPALGFRIFVGLR